MKDGEDYFAQENLVFETFCEKINQELSNKNNQNVYADATHLNQASRKKVLNKINISPESINVLYIKTPLDICIKRNEKRDGRAKVPEQVIKNMYNSIQEPSKKENIDYLYIVEDGKEIVKKEVV